jgi:A/G-specific adenine glycosylase
MTIDHSVTRYAITLTCVEATATRGTFIPGVYSAAKWVTPAALDHDPVSAPQRKLMTALMGE